MTSPQAHIWKLQYMPTWGTNPDWVTELDVEPYELKAHDYRMELLEPMGEDDYVALIQECAKLSSCARKLLH